MQIIKLDVTLREVMPTVRRVLWVPLDILLEDLHTVLQLAMGWENYHLYHFDAFDKGIWSVTDEDDEWNFDDIPIENVSLRLFLTQNGIDTFDYLYDFGDMWVHQIQAGPIEQADPKLLFPELVYALNRCPPEDVGSSMGYEQYLEALADESHVEHDEWLQWRGPFDPRDVPVTILKKDVRSFARQLGFGDSNR